MEKQDILLESGTNEMELMTFEIGSQKFGMNVAKIQSILQFDPDLVTHIPMAHSSMMGMMRYRNNTIPLIDLAEALKMKGVEGAERPVVMITEFNNTVNGFRVGAVDRIHRLYWDKFVPVDELISKYGENIVGSVHIGEDEVLVIDMERVLADIFPDQVLEEVSEETMKKRESLSRENMRIYFAEDSKTIRETVVRSLNTIGFESVIPFENGQKAFDALSTISRRVKDQGLEGVDMPHILLTDIEMPKMDGLTLCKRAKEELGMDQMTVIMFSSLINEQMVTKCKEVGASGYVTKPEINQLAAMLDKVCEQSIAA